jgi:hypothetical protein
VNGYKFPNFIEYVNDCTTFQRKTEATLIRAWRLAVHELAHSKSLMIGIPTEDLHVESHAASLLWIFDTAEWSYEFIWEVLATNQSEFKILLDAVINRSVLPVHIELLEKHDNHVRIEHRWINVPWGILPSYRSDPSLQSYERMRIQDPLDGIYWSLGKFLRLGGEQRLRKYPVCLRYFIQPTARLQTHCGDVCRLKSDPNRREANAEYQRRHRGKLREMLIQKDLKKVKEAKARLRALGEEDAELRWVLEEAKAWLRALGKEDLALELVLEEAKIGKKRWTSLRRWEEKEYGTPRITDLSQL